MIPGMVNGMGNRGINFEELKRLKVNGIPVLHIVNASKLADAVGWYNAVDEHAQAGNKQMAKIALHKLHRLLVEVIRAVGYNYEIEHDLEDLLQYGVKYVEALIGGDSFDIRFNQTNLEWRLMKFRIDHDNFEW